MSNGEHAAATVGGGPPSFRPLACVLALAFAVLLFSGCSRKHKHTAHLPAAPKAQRQPAAEAPMRSVPLGYTEEGIASWYGVPYHGRPAADGEIYDMEKLVAAHRVLPFNTWLKVTNLANGREVSVRVIDRGPFVGGRILDLSKAAARDLELLGPGIGKVRLQVIAAPADVPSSDFYAVQVGAFAQRSNAEAVRADFERRYGTAQLALKQGAVPVWRVLVGREASVAAAQKLADTLANSGHAIFVVRLDERPGNAAAAASSAAPPGPE